MSKLSNILINRFHCSTDQWPISTLTILIQYNIISKLWSNVTRWIVHGEWTSKGQHLSIVLLSRDISWMLSLQLASFKFRFLSQYNAQGIVTELVGSRQTSRYINLPGFNPGFNMSRALSLVRFN